MAEARIYFDWNAGAPLNAAVRAAIVDWLGRPGNGSSVHAEGRAAHPLLAPRLTLSEIRGRAMIIHKGGDNYSDHPEMGGGGERAVCGVIPG